MTTLDALDMEGLDDSELSVSEISEFLLEHGADAPVTIVASWNEEQRTQAVSWAVAQSFQDEIGVVLAARPSFLKLKTL